MVKLRQRPGLAAGGWLLALLATTLVLPSVVDARPQPGVEVDITDWLNEYVHRKGGHRPLFANRPPYIFTHNVGLLQLQVTNLGVFGNPDISASNAGWRGGEYLYWAGLWIGAKFSDGVPHVSTAVNGIGVREFLPPTDPEWTIYEAFEGVQGGNRIGFSTAPTLEVVPGSGVLDVRTSGANDDLDTGDQLLDEDFLNGLDDDGDDLIDEDFEAIGQQMYSCQYWDISPHTRERYPEHDPMNLLVQQRTFAWATTGSNEFIGLDFKVFNIGNETLNDVYIAFFVDADVGPPDKASFWVDDKGGFVSIDTTITDESVNDPFCESRELLVNIAYMYDTPDFEVNEDLGGVKGGDVPGYFGGMFLGHSVDPLEIDAPQQVQIRRAQFFSISEPYPAGDPRNDFESYDLIQGRGTPTRETIRPNDYRFVISAGPFRTLLPREFLTFQTAFVIGEGRQGMIENAVQAQLIYDGVWRNVDENILTGANGRETCIRPQGDAGSVDWSSPCDSTSRRIDWDGYCADANYVDNDCNVCTPRTSSDEPGAETLINWVGTVAPPPPSTNTECDRIGVLAPEGDKRVILQWDNLSELKADPIQRKILFEGYRIWRANDWRRPVGATGPDPDDWMLLEQIVKTPTTPTICLVPSPFVAGQIDTFKFNQGFLGNWVADDPEGLLSDDPCEDCPHFCWPRRVFLQDTLLSPLQTGIATGDTTAGMETASLYPRGYYTYVDTFDLQNGKLYFYDVTAFSAWDQAITVEGDSVPIIQHFELSGRPAATECQQVVPTWPAADSKDEIRVVPNPYIQGEQPPGWDLVPSDADPTGTRIAFANLPVGRNVIKIYTLAGDLVEIIDDQRSTGERGTAFWDLVTRNGQDITAGVYLYTVKTENQGTKVGRFVVIR